MDLINAAGCNATIRSDCRVVATATVGSSPLAAVVDQQTNTVYVVNGVSNTVSVLNGARCNAGVTSGCGAPVATISVGQFPVAAAFDPATRTLYVASPKGHVFVINAASCNAVTTRGCGQPVKQVKDSSGPQALDVDVATNTVYAANNGTGNGDTMSVINGTTCNGRTSSGCDRAPRTIKVGSGAFWDVVDQSTGTVYVANYNDGTVSVINGAVCDSVVTSGCGRTPPTVTTGAERRSSRSRPGCTRSSRSIRKTTRCRRSTPGPAMALRHRAAGRSRQLARPPRSRSRIQPVPRRGRAHPEDRVGVRTDRGRCQRPHGDQRRQLQRGRHGRLPPPGAQRPGS